jgi:hypothetical protein
MINQAKLRQESPFYPLFLNGLVPIKNVILPDSVICEGDGGPQDAYMVDLDKLTPEQFDAVTALVHQQCDPSVPIVVMRKEVKARGLPLRAKHVLGVNTDSCYFL